MAFEQLEYRLILIDLIECFSGIVKVTLEIICVYTVVKVRILIKV